MHLQRDQEDVEHHDNQFDEPYFAFVVQRHESYSLVTCFAS